MFTFLKLVASFLNLQFLAILKQRVLPLLNSHRKSKSASSSYFRKYLATGNIFFQTLTVNLCHCFRIWHPVHQFRGNLLGNSENKHYHTPVKLNSAIHQHRIFERYIYILKHKNELFLYIHLYKGSRYWS